MRPQGAWDEDSVQETASFLCVLVVSSLEVGFLFPSLVWVYKAGYYTASTQLRISGSIQTQPVEDSW